MVILDDLARLHEEEADQRWVLPLLYIVARGLPVTTAATASSLRGHMRTLPVASVREHQPQMQRDILFLVTKGLNAECPALASGIRGVERMNSSRWRVQVIDDKEGLQPAAPAASGAERQPAAPKADAKKQRQPAAPKARTK